MRTIETDKPQRRVVLDVERGVSDVLSVRVPPGTGALIIVGPSAGELPGLEALLEVPNVEPVEALGARLMSWKTASAEVIEVGRGASQVIREGRTAVVYLDSHSGDAPAIPADKRSFVCARLGQIMIGIADVPGYVITHGERMAQSLIIDSLEDPDAESVGSISSGYPIWRLSTATMFPGVCVSLCPGDRPADPIIELLEWFEARRC